MICNLTTSSVYKYVISTNTYTLLLTLPSYGFFIDCDSTGKLYITTQGGTYTSSVSGQALTSFTSTGITPALPNGSPVYVDSLNNAYFSDYDNGRILKYSSGTWSVVFSNTNYNIGPIAISSSGNIYVQYNSKSGSNIYYNIGMVANSTTITYISGTNMASPGTFGVQTYAAGSTSQENVLASNATFASPGRIQVDSGDNIYIADRYNNRIRVIQYR
jgi:hypothetical protein